MLDIDADGDLDLVVQCVEKPAVLLVNRGTKGHALQVQLRGTRSNRDAIGARVEVRLGTRWLQREVGTSHGFISGRSKTCHFGLGDATRVDEVVVHWPAGGVTRRFGLAADQVLRLVEPR